MTFRIGLLAAACALSLSGLAQAATLTPIASYVDPAGGRTSVLGVNNAGWMTGSVTATDGTATGFIRDAAGVYTLFSAGTNTYGRAIDNSNNVSGYATDATQDQRTDREFIRAPTGALTTLSNPATGIDLHGIAQGMNASGAIVGDYFSSPDGAHGPQLGYILDGGVLTTLSGPPGAQRVAGRGIEDDGTVAGWAVIGGVASGFIYSGGAYTLFGHAGAANTYFEDINNSGLVAGEWVDGGGASHAFEFNSLTHAFTDIIVPGAANSQAFGLNDAGDVVVNTSLATGPNNFLFNAGGVPEPTTWALMLLGFGGMGALLRSKRRAQIEMG